MANLMPKNLSEALKEAEEDYQKKCPPADPWLRLGATLLDGIFISLACTSSQRVFLALIQYAGVEKFFEGWLFPHWPYLLRVLSLGALFTLYTTTLITQQGSTLGQKLLHLKVVSLNPRKSVKWTQILYRETVLKVCFLLYGPWEILKHPQLRLFIHDRKSQTQVVQLYREL